MNIMHVIDSLARGGAERMLVDLANQTARDGGRVSVCVTRRATDLAKDLRPEIALHVLDRRRRFALAPVLRLARLIREEEVDVLHAHGRSSFSLLALARELRLVRQPVVLHDHTGTCLLDDSVPAWFRFRGRCHVAHFIGVHPGLGAWAKSAGLSNDRISVVGNALDLRRCCTAAPIDLQGEFGIPEGTVVGVAVGNIRPEKGIRELLLALSLRTSRLPLKVLVIGGDADPLYALECRDLCRTLALEGCVAFTGQRGDVLGLIRGADFALMPSLSESGPLVIIEYFSCSIPLVSTDGGEVCLKCRDFGADEFVPAGDPRVFAAALDRLLALSPDERKARGRAGKEIAFQHFDIVQTVSRFYQIYAQVSGKRVP